MEQILNIAGRLLDRRLTDPVDLGGSSRSSVLRCRTEDGGSVVVKAFAREPDSLRAFTAEAAGLGLGLAGPELLGVDADFPLLVMADLGTAPTLADLLLGDDPKAAGRALLAWAEGLGRLAARSVTGRQRFGELWARYDQGRPSWGDDPWAAENAARLPQVLAAAGIEPPPGLAGELAALGTMGAERFPAFTPGDTCPDNNLITAQGLRLLDFEAACFQSVFLTAAYCRMPFSSCWCVFELPAGLADEIEQAYRAQLVPVYPELAEEAVWARGTAAAIAEWTVDATVRHLASALLADRPMHRSRRPVPTLRQVLRHRWRSAAGLTGCPAFAGTCAQLLAATAEPWSEVPPLPGYPAFRQA
jgi:hypothetical protein